MEVGHIVYDPLVKDRNLEKKYSKITLRYPVRLEAMALDPSLVAMNAKNDYRAGQMLLKVSLFRECSVKINQTGDINIDVESDKKSLCMHAGKLMQNLLKSKLGFDIKYIDKVSVRHSGFGSSSACIAAICYGINELFGNYFTNQEMVNILAMNHGEEIDGDNGNIIPVQCLGGSAICGQTEGGLLITAGERKVIASCIVSDQYSVIILLPKNLKMPDSNKLMDSETDNMDSFIRTGKLFSSNVAYRLIHEVLPEMTSGQIKSAGSLAWDYRYHMGSIKNCSFAYKDVINISNELNKVYEIGEIDFLSMSSVGPGFFAVIKEDLITKYIEIFESLGLECRMTKPFNKKYIIDYLK